MLTILAVLLFPTSLLALVQGETTFSNHNEIVLLVFSMGCGVNAWIMCLRLMLRSQGLDAVSWYDMPSLTRRAGSREQRWLGQWRLATMAKLAVEVVFLLVIAALLTGRVAHDSAATATVTGQPAATATPNPLAGIGPIVNTHTECWVSPRGTFRHCFCTILFPPRSILQT